MENTLYLLLVALLALVPARAANLLLVALLALVPTRAADGEAFPWDPVELVKGKEIPGTDAHSVAHLRYTYRFASEANRAAFEADPGRYRIQLGGACARMGPLSGEGSTAIHTVYEGRIYIFASEQCRTGFLAAPERLLQADDPVPASTEEALSKGDELLELALHGIGGVARVNSVRTWLRSRVERSTYDGREIESGDQLLVVQGKSGPTIVFEKFWDDWRKTAVSGADESFFREDDTRWTMDPAQTRAVERKLQHCPLGILQARKRSDFVAVALGKGQVGEVATERLAVAFDGTTTTLDIDPGTGRVLATSYRGRGPGVVLGEVQEIWSDFQQVGELTLPTKCELRFEGEAVSGERIYSYEIDGEVDPSRLK